MATRPETDAGIAAAVLDLAGIAADTSPEGREAVRCFAGAPLRRGAAPPGRRFAGAPLRRGAASPGRRSAGALRRAGLPLAAVTASGDAPAPVGRTAPDVATAGSALDAAPERMVAVSASAAGVSEAATAGLGLRAEPAESPRPAATRSLAAPASHVDRSTSGATACQGNAVPA